MLQCVAFCVLYFDGNGVEIALFWLFLDTGSVLQCVTACYRMLQRVAVCFKSVYCTSMGKVYNQHYSGSFVTRVACCSVLQYVAVCWRVLQCFAVCCRVLKGALWDFEHLIVSLVCVCVSMCM